MKSSFCILALIVVAAPAASQSKLDEDCKIISLVSELFMSSHQAGVPMTSVMEKMGQHFPEMIVQAYDSPRYLTEDSKSQAISAFRDEMTVACYKGEVVVPDSIRP